MICNNKLNAAGKVHPKMLPQPFGDHIDPPPVSRVRPRAFGGVAMVPPHFNNAIAKPARKPPLIFNTVLATWRLGKVPRPVDVVNAT